MKLFDKYSEEFLGVGIGVMLVGIAVFAWGQSRFDDFLNYQRLALFIPLCFGGLLISLGTFANWTSASSLAKGWAVGLALSFVLVVSGTLGWWLLAPSAQG